MTISSQLLQVPRGPDLLLLRINGPNPSSLISNELMSPGTRGNNISLAAGPGIAHTPHPHGDATLPGIMNHHFKTLTSVPKGK